MASLGLVSPGAATDGVTLFFLPQKLTTFFFSFFSFLVISSGDRVMIFFSCRLLTTPEWYPTKINYSCFNLEKNTKFSHKNNFSRVSL